MGSLATTHRLGGTVRAKDTENDVLALNLLLAAVGQKVRLQEELGRDTQVIFVHAHCLQDDYAALKSARQMPVKKLEFYKFGENFDSKKRDNCFPIWMVGALSFWVAVALQVVLMTSPLRQMAR